MAKPGDRHSQPPTGAPMGAEPRDHSLLIREAVRCPSPSPLPKVLGGPLQDRLGNVGHERMVTSQRFSGVGGLQESFHIRPLRALSPAPSQGVCVSSGVSSNQVSWMAFTPFSFGKEPCKQLLCSLRDIPHFLFVVLSLHCHLGDGDSLPAAVLRLGVRSLLCVGLTQPSSCEPVLLAPGAPSSGANFVLFSFERLPFFLLQVVICTAGDSSTG